ncbi:MAG: hypothetical protein AAFN77_12525 [Planctomycetota bacterium]
MSKGMTWILAVLFVCGMLMVDKRASGHEIFQDVLKEVYTLKSFSCKTCHPESKDRNIRSAFAERIYKKMKPMKLTEKYAAAVKADEAAKAKDPESVGKDKGAVFEFDKMAGEAFKKSFKEVAKETMTIDDMIKQGLFNGARLDTKKLEEKAKQEGESKEEK